MKVFIIHGSFGSPEGNWFPWLKKQLKNLGHEVYVPRFPIEDYEFFSKDLKKNPLLKPKNQNLSNWLRTFYKYLSKLDHETVFVAHSIGPAFVLHLLEQIDTKIRACIFVSPFLGRIGIPEFDAVNSSFVDDPINWGKVKQNCRDFYVVSSDDDPYVPFKFTRDFRKKLEQYTIQEGKVLANYLNVKYQMIKGGKHLNAEAGYTTFLYVFTLINKLVLTGGKNPITI
jgi:predicted alpha/beta hydrolase family esterase